MSLDGANRYVRQRRVILETEGGSTLTLCELTPEGEALLAGQPLPAPNATTPILDLVQADIAARDRVGRAKYGTPLQAGNGRDALRDAYEEALDLAFYLRQAIAERDGR